MTVILLAAGLSERMGQNKLLLPFKGKPLLLSTLEAALSYTKDVVVVTGHEREEIERIVKQIGVRTVFAPEYASGQKASTIRGIESVDDDFAILPGDLPLITRDDFRGTEELLSTHSIARACYQGEPGHPVMFRKEHKERLLAFKGSMKEYLALVGNVGKYEGSIGSVRDADTPESYRSLINLA